MTLVIAGGGVFRLANLQCLRFGRQADRVAMRWVWGDHRLQGKRTIELILSLTDALHFGDGSCFHMECDSSGLSAPDATFQRDFSD
ncbi:MAG: hypothetical protein KDB22_16140 [Planctomycetales bacterium]|nr:hypothetical protein [Planctomycetales bacterium]